MLHNSCIGFSVCTSTLFLCFVWQVGAMIGASSVNLKLILTEQTIAGFLFHRWTLFRGCLILVEILGMGDKRMLMSWWGQQLFFVGVSLVVEFLSISQLMRLKFIWFRFVIDMMQSVCLDEFGGEKVVPPRAQETTLIQYIFGGLLQSQVLFPYLSRRSCAVFANTNNTLQWCTIRINTRMIESMSRRYTYVSFWFES